MHNSKSIKDIKNMLKDLTSLVATSGTEEDELEKVYKYFSDKAAVETDALGNLIATYNKDGETTVLLDAHFDRIGLVIRGIDPKGFLLVDKVGGTDERTLVGAEVKVYGKTELRGVICSTPPHLLTDKDKEKGVEISNLAVDIGMNREEAAEYVSIGDRAVVCGEFTELICNCVSAGGLDDRSGVVAVINAAEQVSDKLSTVCLKVVLSSQEETGGSGAKCASFTAGADYAISVDVGFGVDASGHNSGETIVLGKGASIGYSPVLDRMLTLKLKKICETENIPYQHDVMSGRTGTNADHICISKGGVKTALLSIPLKYMHTPVEVVNLTDIENTSTIIEKFIMSLEEEKNA